MPKLRALLWAGVSSKPQVDGKESLPEQLADGKAYADRMGWRVVGQLTVPGHSRDYIFFQDAARDIPAYANLANLTGDFDVLICRGRDRLGRTDALIAQVEAIVGQAGAQVLSLAMPQPIGGSDRGALYVAAIERAGAQAEMVELRRRHESGMRGRTLSGKHPNNVPYPYVKNSDGSVSLPQDRVGVVRRIYDQLVVQKRSYGVVCRALNGEHIPSPGGKSWTPTGIRSVLSNPFLRGIVLFGRHTRALDQQIAAASQYPAVFSDGEAVQIDAEMERRKTFRSGATSGSPWTGIVVCARCGYSMRQHVQRQQQRVYHAYRCAKYQLKRRIGERACHHNYTPLRKIEAAARAALEQIIADEAVFASVLERQEGGQFQQLTQELDAAQTAIGRIEAERDRLTTAYLRGILQIDEYETQMERLALDLATQKQTSRSLLAELQHMPDPRVREAELRELLPQLPEAIVNGDRAILHATFRRIECENGKVVRVSFV